MSKLGNNRYGKHRVRVLKVMRSGDEHEVCEIEADVMLSGELEGAYLSGDNASIVPTDTVKNTVHCLAHDCLDGCVTSFADLIGRHFLEKYEHLTGVDVELRERRWGAMKVGGKAHGHAFVSEGNGEWFTRGRFVRCGAVELSAGVRDHLILKTTGSGFSGYNVCDLTTLPPTDDRILSTRVTAEWFFDDLPDGVAAVEKLVLAEVYRVFAENYSPSVQRTLFEIGEAVLAAVPGLLRIELSLPNVHFLNLDLSRLGRPDQKVVFLPTDEPHGEIQAVVTR